MRILSLAVRDFRGVAERKIEPAPQGVTVVAGPNEVGKTSLAEALDLLFDRLDSSVAQEVKDAQPVGRDVGPEVEAEIAAGDYRFRYRKRFLRRPETVLRVSAPAAEDHTGREAHERVLAILEEAGVDLRLWRALRVQQGAGVAQPEGLASAASLLDALGSASLAQAGGGGEEGDEEGDEESGGDGGASGDGTAVGRRGADLHRRARSEAERYYTPKRGEPTGELRAALDERAAAVQEAAALEAEMSALEDDAERAGELERSLVALRGAHREAVEEERRRSAEAVEVGRLEGEVESLRTRLVEAEGTLDLLHELEAARQAEHELDGRLRSAQREAERARQALQPARQALEEATAARAAAQTEHERRREALRLAEALEQRRVAARQLDGRAERARRAVERAAAAQARLDAEAKVEAADVERLEGDEREIERLESGLAAASPRLELRALQDLVLGVGGGAGGDGAAVEVAAKTSEGEAGGSQEAVEEVGLAAGESWESQPVAPVRLTLPGIAELTVTPGGDASELSRRLRAVRGRLRAGCVALGVADVSAARQALARRNEARSEREAARAVLGEVLGASRAGAAADDDESAVRRLDEQRREAAAEVDRLAARLAALLAQGSDAEAAGSAPLPAPAPTPTPTPAQAEEALAAAREAAEAAAQAEETARAAAEARRRELESASSLERELGVERRNAGERRQRAGERASELLRRRGWEAVEKVPGTGPDTEAEDAAPALQPGGEKVPGTESGGGAEDDEKVPGTRPEGEPGGPEKVPGTGDGGGGKVPGTGPGSRFGGATEAVEKVPGTVGGSADQLALFAAVSASAVGGGAATAGDPAADPAAGLAAARSAAESRVAAAGAALAAARLRLAEAEPRAVHRRAEQAAAAAGDAARRLREAEDERLTLRTRLEAAGERGLYERLEEARGRRSAAVAAAAAIAARATAARRLLRALDDAREAARRAYSEPLRRTIEELGAPLYGDGFAVELGADLTVVRRTAFSLTLETERLSTGAQEQLSLLSRLACAVLVSPMGGVPLLLDDALGNTDPGRSAALAEVLARAGERCQVLVLTCTPERYRGIAGARVLDLAAPAARQAAATGDEGRP